MTPRPRLPHSLARSRALAAAALAVVCARASAQSAPAAAPPANAAQTPGRERDAAVSAAEGRPVAEVRVEGLSRVADSLVRNQLRTREGEPYSERTAREDVRRLYRLGEFRSVEAATRAGPEGSVVVVFTVIEAKLIKDVQVVGNRRISDQDLAEKVNIKSGTPADEFQVGRATRAIEELYRNKGYFNVNVTVDERELEENGIILFRIREGERIKVTDVRFSGNQAFPARQLRPEVNTTEAGIFERGPVDEGVLDRDVAALVKFYQDRGYLDVRCDRRITPSPDGKEAIVTFVIDEGPLYTLRSVRAVNADDPSAPLIFTNEQIVGLMVIKPGDAFGLKAVQQSVDAIKAAYWRLGRADAVVTRQDLREPSAPPALVDLQVVITEGRTFRAGEVIIQGNTITQQKVIRREVQVTPDRPLDRGQVRDTERRLAATGLFDRGANPPKVTIQPESPDSPDHRDVLVEVTETNTGALSFGAAIGSDAGLVGSINLSQRNFDLLDTPESFDEFIRGQAFRGAGQTFNLSIAPGLQVSTYSLSVADPHVLETDYSLGVEGFYRNRKYDEYSEERFGGVTRIGRQLGDRWFGSLTTRANWIELSKINASAPVDVFQVADRRLLTGLGFSMTRTTVPPADRFRPTRGTRLELAVEQVGALGGDFDFTKLSGQYQLWLPIYEDYLGRKGVLSFSTQAGYIPQQGEAPVYERYYLGGRSFRGFDYRTVSPKGIRNDTGVVGGDPVGGRWLFFFGSQYEQPVWREILSVVAFIDSGTVTNNVGFSQYRVSAGGGIRLYIPQLGQAPLAFDLAVPLKKEDGDRKQLFSFSVDIPF